MQRRTPRVLAEHPAPRLPLPALVLSVDGVRERALVGGAVRWVRRLRIRLRVRNRRQLRTWDQWLEQLLLARGLLRARGSPPAHGRGGEHRDGHRVQHQRLLLGVAAVTDVV